MKLELNDPVVILRGGIDGFPQVSLAGVAGRVCSTHANALPGMVSVWVDWSKTRHADVDGLPNVINNFPADLAPAREEAAAPKAAPGRKKPPFKLAPLAPVTLEPEADPEAPPEAEPSQEPPKLRLL